jgi:hypothetical protein
VEHQIEEKPIVASPRDSDAWIRHLEQHGVLTAVGGPDDPCKVVALSGELWGWSNTERSTSQSAIHSKSGASLKSIQSQSTSDPPRPPAEFIEDLRRQRIQKRSSLTKVGSYSVPRALQQFAERIVASRSLAVDEQSIDDDENHVLEATWERAVTFIIMSAIRFWEMRHIAPPIPMINADLDGGIDVVWRNRHRSLYMNVPEEPANVVTFYGRDQKNPDLRFRGEENSEGSGEWIFGWLVR